MKASKKYACHRVYDASGHYLNQSVVSLAPDGKMNSCFPLNEETFSTEWLGGVIVLSNQAEICIRPDFRTWIHGTEIDFQVPVYAWHISDFDFECEELTSRSIIRRLPFSV